MNNLDAYLQTKDITLLHKWVEENYNMFLHLAYKIKKRHNIKSLTIEELISECVIAFYSSIDKYNPEISKPTTYIYTAIEWAIINKLKHFNATDFANRVGAFSLDAEFTTEESAITYSDIVSDGTDESADVMNKIMLDNFREYMSNYKDGLTKEVYNLYIQGYTMVDIGKQLGYTKQYISKILKNLVQEIRTEWNLE